MTPDVRVVRGEPDDVELAALVAGLAATAAPASDVVAGHQHAPAAPEDAAGRRWRAAARPGGGVPAPGPDAWRWSARA